MDSFEDKTPTFLSQFSERTQRSFRKAMMEKLENSPSEFKLTEELRHKLQTNEDVSLVFEPSKKIEMMEVDEPPNSSKIHSTCDIQEQYLPVQVSITNI